MATNYINRLEEENKALRAVIASMEEGNTSLSMYLTSEKYWGTNNQVCVADVLARMADNRSNTLDVRAANGVME